jgi:Putative zinc-finger
MSHLGRWLSALVDGELDPVERDRVLNHLAGCQACLHEANAMRALKRRLTALGDTGADTAIASRLIELAQSDHELSDAASSAPGSRPRPDAWHSRQRRSRQPLPSWLMAVGTTGTAIVAFGFAAFLLGNGQDDPAGPRVTPSVDSFLLQHYYDAGQEPAAGNGPAVANLPSMDRPAQLDIGRRGGQTRTGRPSLGPFMLGELVPGPLAAGQAGAAATMPTSSPAPSATPAVSASAPSVTPTPAPASQSPGGYPAQHNPG